MINLGSREIKIITFLRRQAIEVEPVRGAKIAAAIVFKNDIISIGKNQMKTDPFQAKFSSNPESIFLHAEISAIKGALYHLELSELKKSSLYIYRIKRPMANHKGKWITGSAKPCEGCLGAITEFEIPKVVFTTDENDIFEILSNK